MHSCLLLITKEFPTEEVIEKALEPYSEELYDERLKENSSTSHPTFDWDYYVVGGRYNGLLKLKVAYDNEKYEWCYYSRKSKNNRLFLSYLLTQMEELYTEAKRPFRLSCEDYFNSLGFRDGYIRVDGAFVDDILNFDDIECCCYIDKNENAYTREYFDYEKNMFVENTDFDERLKKVKADSNGCYATIIDLHD